MAGIGRVRTIWSGGATSGSLSTHYFGPDMSVATVAEAQACIDRVRDFWLALNGGIHASATWTIDGLVDIINPVTGFLAGSVAGVARTSTGTNGAEPLPFQTQGLIRWNTNTVADGHRLRGHTFIPAPCETDNGVGAPVAAYTTRLAAASTAMLAAGTFSLHVWHRPIYDAGGTLLRNGSIGAVTGGSGQGSWAVLRSRRS